MLAGRVVPRVYRVIGRDDLHAFLLDAVRQSGGTVLYASEPKQVPVYIGLEDPDRHRVGLMIYPFRMTRKETWNRPSDEVRGQLRYGAEETWPEEDHFVAQDIAGVDTTLLLGLYPEGNLILGLDPALYNPLPLGISVYAKDEQVAAVAQDGWTVWERTNQAGTRRTAPRAGEGLETLVAFHPARLLDYARFEQIECKNTSPERYGNGDIKVEVQKTRATKNDPAGRLYRPDQFDIVAACLYAPTRHWTFTFIRSSRLDRHASHPDRLAATHHVDARWSATLEEALAQPAG